jgi:cytochrome P450
MDLLYIILLILILFIIINWNNILINYRVFFIINRGLINPNCFWWNMSSLLLNDPNGVNLYNKLKSQYGEMVPVNVLGTNMFLVNNINHIKEILDHSPDTFCVGRLKYNFFKPFMRLNVGVSKGCPWKRRRILNDDVLFNNQLHIYADYYNYHINKILEKHIPLNFEEFQETAKKIISRTVFNKEMIPEQIFKIFAIANTPSAVINPNFELPKDINKFYRNFIWEELQNPQPNSLVSLCADSNLEKEELIDQVPHWIFPIGGIMHTVTTRALVMLCNDKRVLNKLIRQLRQIDINDANDIYRQRYLRNCILETLRLNNLVTSTFRTLCEDYTFKDGRSFNKGTQFLILNNPVLRENECFEESDKYIPERWNDVLEKSYCSIMFNQGPQKCPGKEISIFLIKSFIIHYLKHTGVLYGDRNLITQKIDQNKIPQMINPCQVAFQIV